MLKLDIIQVGLPDLRIVRRLNEIIFQEARLINRMDRADLLMLLAQVDQEPVGFKVGYALNPQVFYSAKGGVLPDFRRHGVAAALLADMMARVQAKGYKRFVYDTFPNIHPGMLVLGLNQGFRVTEAEYNAVMKDFRIQLEKPLGGV